MPGEKITALLGGSFNPPHLAHLLAAGLALSRADCEALWLVPCFAHPFGKGLASFEDRSALCERLIAPFGPRLKVSGIEGELGGTSYTVRTLEELSRRHPGRKWAWLIGSDNVEDLPRWKESERLAALARLWVVPRSDAAAPAASGGASLEWLGSTPLPAISSTEIRERIADGKPVTGLTAKNVAEEIARRGLYR